ncbi:hypothetical protein HMPREF3127_13250 [Sphingobacterium sp. HMSC13C05]|nr:hypothetical protein HMPREF3127_13250 [Sphingobacterium sp. HMSC13C05]
MGQFVITFLRGPTAIHKVCVLPLFAFVSLFVGWGTPIWINSESAFTHLTTCCEDFMFNERLFWKNK